MDDTIPASFIVGYGIHESCFERRENQEKRTVSGEYRYATYTLQYLQRTIFFQPCFLPKKNNAVGWYIFIYMSWGTHQPTKDKVTPHA